MFCGNGNAMIKTETEGERSPSITLSVITFLFPRGKKQQQQLSEKNLRSGGEKKIYLVAALSNFKSLSNFCPIMTNRYAKKMNVGSVPSRIRIALQTRPWRGVQCDASRACHTNQESTYSTVPGHSPTWNLVSHTGQNWVSIGWHNPCRINPY